MERDTHVLTSLRGKGTNHLCPQAGYTFKYTDKAACTQGLQWQARLGDVMLSAANHLGQPLIGKVGPDDWLG